MGYFLGNKIYSEISKELGPTAAVRISPEDFRTRAEKVLLDLAGP
jgi:hypothetical protein